MQDNAMSLVERVCRTLVLQFAQFNDDRRFDDVANLFHEDGSFSRPLNPERVLYGRAAILADLQARPVELTTFHVCSNVLIETESADRAHGVSYFTVYLQQGRSTGAGPMRFTGQTFIGRYHDVFEWRTGVGWKIAVRDGRVHLYSGNSTIAPDSIQTA